MKHSHVTTSLTALIALGIAACSSAVPGSPGTGNTQEEVEVAEAQAAGPADEASPPPPRHGPPSPERLLQHLDRDGNGVVERDEIPPFFQDADTNNDGRLTVEELRAHGHKMRAEHFARKDKNSDGFLTKDEVGEHRWEKLSVADADQDGKLSRAELDQAHADGKLPKIGPGHHKGMGRHGRRHGPKDPAAFIGKLDQNNDGVLQLTELPEHKRQHLGAADTNKDQALSRDELDAFFKTHRPKRFGPPR